MDVISNGDPAPRSNRRRAAWGLVVVVAVAGLYGLRHLTENRPPAHTSPPAAAPTTGPARFTVDEVHATNAVVAPELPQKALQALSQNNVKGAMDLIGTTFANGVPEIGLVDESLGGKGTYVVAVVCFGVGGADVSVTDQVRSDAQPPEILRLVCTGRPATTTVTLSDGRLLITLNPDPETVAGFAYAVAPKAA